MQETQTEKVNLLDLDKDGMIRFFTSIGEKAFRAQQLLRWIHKNGVSDFDLMTDISFALREKLKKIAIIEGPKVLSEQLSNDGTRKWLFSAGKNSAIETIYIPETNRGTLCVSSQVGCILNCKFCHTGQQGFQRNLKASEIIGQMWHVVHELKKLNPEQIRSPITNVVFMGMGEPLLNYDNVLIAIRLMQEDLAYCLSKKRVTVSTSGVIPFMDKLIADTDVSLAVSLHAATDEVRTKIMPINKKYSLDILMKTCKDYVAKNKKRKVTMEYVMLDGINDQKEHAYQLIKLLKNVPSKINLIPFNPFSGSSYACSTPEAIKKFQDILIANKFIATIRKTRGEDIDAACGQLAGRVKDRTRRSIPYKQERKYHLPVVIVQNTEQNSEDVQSTH
jgi:23S rRNA (adenine2503-C2)-methyltransferase